MIGVRHKAGLRPGQLGVLSELNRDLLAFGMSNSFATAQVSAMVGRIFSVDDSLELPMVFGCLLAVSSSR